MGRTLTFGARTNSLRSDKARETKGASYPEASQQASESNSQHTMGKVVDMGYLEGEKQMAGSILFKEVSSTTLIRLRRSQTFQITSMIVVTEIRHVNEFKDVLWRHRLSNHICPVKPNKIIFRPFAPSDQML